MERRQVKASLNNEARKLVEEGKDEWAPPPGRPASLSHAYKRLLLSLLHTSQNTQKIYSQLEIPKSKYGLRILSF
jgi:hypothetical protein